MKVIDTYPMTNDAMGLAAFIDRHLDRLDGEGPAVPVVQVYDSKGKRISVAELRLDEENGVYSIHLK